MLNRRLVEGAMLRVNEFTIKDLLYGLDDVWIRPDRTILNNKDLVLGMDQLANAGTLIGFKDRGTGSTSDIKERTKSCRGYKRLYNEQF